MTIEHLESGAYRASDTNWEAIYDTHGQRIGVNADVEETPESPEFIGINLTLSVHEECLCALKKTIKGGSKK